MRLNAITVSKAVINQSRFIFPLQIETHFGSTFSPSLFSRILPTFHRQSRLNPRAEPKPKKKKEEEEGKKNATPPLSRAPRERAQKPRESFFSRNHLPSPEEEECYRSPSRNHQPRNCRESIAISDEEEKESRSTRSKITAG